MVSMPKIWGSDDAFGKAHGVQQKFENFESRASIGYLGHQTVSRLAYAASAVYSVACAVGNVAFGAAKLASSATLGYASDRFVGDYRAHRDRFFGSDVPCTLKSIKGTVYPYITNEEKTKGVFATVGGWFGSAAKTAGWALTLGYYNPSAAKA